MAKASVLARPAQKVSNLTSIPAPTGGLNARDSLMAMSPDQAVTLKNIFPQRYGAQLRLGWARHAVLAAPAAIETLMNYADHLGTEKLFAIAGGTIWDVTTQAAAPVATGVTGLSNSRWQYTQLTNVQGSFLVAVNGVDPPIIYNGTTWSNLALVLPASPPAGTTINKMIHVHLVHRRLWFTEINSTRAWYLPVDQVAGTLAMFDAGELFSRGGFLQCVKSWTVDAAAGSDDHVVLISSKGDIAVYTGFDPTVATDFTLDGVYRIGSTLGRRCATKFGSDLLIFCEDGVLPLTSILAQSKILNPTPLTDLIQLKLSEDVGTFSTLYGWEPVVSNRANQLYLNIPTSVAAGVMVYRQYVMNTVTGAWCEFENYNGVSWAVHKNELFFGTPNGIVGHAWFGTLDNYDFALDTGGAIPAQALCAFAYLGRGAQQKHITMARATMQAPIEPQFRLTVNVDFKIEDDSPPIPPANASTIAAKWDQAIWDQDVWGAASTIFKRWVGVGEIGFCAATFLKTSTSFGYIWVSTDLLVEEGAVL